MTDVVSELTAQALSQIAEGSDVSTQPNTRLERARQELQDALANAHNNLPHSNLPPNTFGGALRPVGTPEELHDMCVLLANHSAELSYDELADSDNLVYEVRINADISGVIVHNNYWVNDYWHNEILAAAGVVENETTSEGVQLSPEEEDLLAAALENEHHEIPENSATITVDETTSRFSGAIWYEQIRKQTVTLAGVGGIGSYIGFLLGRLKPARLIIYDPDKVEAVNMSGQLYGREDLDAYKAVALANMLKRYADYYKTVVFAERFTEESEATDIMICGFDNMEARKLFYNKWKAHIRDKSEEEKAKCLFIDGRLAAEEYQVLSIQGNDSRAMAEYEDKWLFSDAEAEETICSYKQTTFMANMIASTMVNIFVNFIANQCGPIIDRDVPFFISYDASTMFTKVVM